jgi:hypothetical protein
MQNLHKLKWEREILRAARSSKDEQLDHFGKQKYEHGGRLNVEIRVFMEAAQEPLCLDKPSMLQ